MKSMWRVVSCVVGRGCLLWLVVLLAKLCWPLPCFILCFKTKSACYSRYLLTSYFCIPIPCDEKDIFLFLVLVLEGLEVFISSVQSLSRVWTFVTPWTTACQASLSITNSQGLLKLMSIESVMPSNHLILCHPLLLLPSIFPSIRVFSNESALRIRWPKYWNLSFNMSLSNEHPGLISFRMDWLDLLAVQGTPRVLSNTTVQKHQIFCTQLSL